MSITYTTTSTRQLHYDPLNFSGAHASRQDCEHGQGGNYRFIKKIGSGDNGEVHLALWRPSIASVLANYATESWYQQLRANLVVIKVALDHRLENDLSAEYIILGHVLRVEHPSYTAVIAGCLDGPVQWLVQNFIRGGALRSSGASGTSGGFVAKHPEAFTLSFRWHIGAVMAANMLFVLYGITDISQSQCQPATNHPRITHGDLFHCNILLDASGGRERFHSNGSTYGNRAYRDFPDLVIADFGRAKVHPPDDDYTYYLGAVRDINILGTELGRLPIIYGELDECVEELEWWEWSARLLNFGHREDQGFDETTFQPAAIAILQHFARVAKDRREQYYQGGIPAAAVATLRKEAVSDSELDYCILESLASQ